MNIVKKISLLVAILAAGLIFVKYANSETEDYQIETTSTADGDTTSSEEILGYSFLSRIPGLWNGPVTTNTPAGNFPAWYVDFRPVSASMVSQYTTINATSINYLSFFIVKHDGKLKIAMRTEGVHDNKGCVTYEVMDSVREEDAYYRFSDFQSGASRAYTEFVFKKDKMTMIVFTNQFNKLDEVKEHSTWNAKLGDASSADFAIEHFNYPQPIMQKDFTNAFTNLTESIYYTFENDPYPSSPQPYVGNVTVNIAIEDNLKLKDDDELFILLTTESLFEGLKYNKDSKKYYSKYAFLPVDKSSFTFTNVHPGKYYLYSFNDINGDKLHKSGDYMSSDLSNIIEVPANGEITVDTRIDFIIP